MDSRQRVGEIDQILKRRYPETTNLTFQSPFNLLVAAILAAQCTDERVNRVTENLFDRYPEPRSFAEAPLEEIEDAVRPTGYYRQKARTLKTCCRELVTRYRGELPADVAELTTLTGVGRKTANLVLGNSLGVPGVFVDTHVKRVSHRLGLTANTNPDKIEADLTPLIDPQRQVAFSNLLTHLGREICTARKAKCSVCPVNHLCPKVGVADHAT
jgi:endonuclease-3